MNWNPEHRPRLRPLEPFRLSPRAADSSDAVIGIRDPSGLSDVCLTLSPAALQLLALMDGSNTCAQICETFLALSGQPLTVETLRTTLAHLEHAHFLEGPVFEEHYQSLLAGYRAREVRPMPHAVTLGIDGVAGAPFAEMLAGHDAAPLAGRIVGAIAPHLDYPRGRPCYAAAYAALRQRRTPDRVVILGTNHFGRSSSVAATASAFETPLGVTRVDAAFLERLERRCGDLRTFELDHEREHSIELQVPWLQYLYGAAAFTIVPVLCPDPCGPTATAPHDGRGVDLRTFALALAELIDEDDIDTLLVAGADFSHVGANFGDTRPLDEAFLSQTRERDHRALHFLEKGDAESFRLAVAEDENPTRVCSAGCIYALAIAAAPAEATVLGYHQAVDQPTQTCVTCAAVVYTR